MATAKRLMFAGQGGMKARTSYERHLKGHDLTCAGIASDKTYEEEHNELGDTDKSSIGLGLGDYNWIVTHVRRYDGFQHPTGDQLAQVLMYWVNNDKDKKDAESLFLKAYKAVAVKNDAANRNKDLDTQSVRKKVSKFIKKMAGQGVTNIPSPFKDYRSTNESLDTVAERYSDPKLWNV